MIRDICFMAAGFFLGGDVGIVTAAVAFFPGPVIAWVGKKPERFISVEQEAVKQSWAERRPIGQVRRVG